jgi:hypothetical protein
VRILARGYVFLRACTSWLEYNFFLRACLLIWWPLLIGVSDSIIRRRESLRTNRAEYSMNIFRRFKMVTVIVATLAVAAIVVTATTGDVFAKSSKTTAKKKK